MHASSDAQLMAEGLRAVGATKDIYRVCLSLLTADVLEAPGRQHLVVTHKYILRALICVSLGLPPTSFRAFDVNNGGICTFRHVAQSSDIGVMY